MKNDIVIETRIGKVLREVMLLRHIWLKAHPKKKVKYSKPLVTFIVILNVAFAYRVLDIFEKTGVEPVTLIKCWFWFTVGELGALAGIKIAKTVTNKKRKQIEKEIIEEEEVE